jgi:release factor glutamine methyltransferase
MSGAWTVAQAMATARAAGVDRLDAQWMLCHVFGQPRSWLLAHDEALLSAQQSSQLRDWIDRRAAGEPLAYLTGEREFHGLRLQVTPDVLIPRADTETLVDWALELLRKADEAGRAPQVLDLGTGSGASALALRHAHPHAEVTAIDVSPAALVVARANAQRLGLSVRFRQSDWWQTVAGERFSLIVSNPPYIADGDAHLNALAHEPQLALTSGLDGLDAIREIAASASAHLAPNGWLLLEHGHDQADAVAELLRQGGLAAIETRRDFANVQRCTGGQQKSV